MSKNHQPKSHHQAKPSDKIRRTTNLPDFYLGGLGVRLCWRPSVSAVWSGVPVRWSGIYGGGSGPSTAFL